MSNETEDLQIEQDYLCNVLQNAIDAHRQWQLRVDEAKSVERMARDELFQIDRDFYLLLDQHRPDAVGEMNSALLDRQLRLGELADQVKQRRDQLYALKMRKQEEQASSIEASLAAAIAAEKNKVQKASDELRRIQEELKSKNLLNKLLSKKGD